MIEYPLAIWRVARMLTQEDGPFGVFLTIRNRLLWDERVPEWVAEGAHCFSCVSFWIAFVLFLCPRWLIRVLAGAALAKLLNDYLYEDQRA